MSNDEPLTNSTPDPVMGQPKNPAIVSAELVSSENESPSVQPSFPDEGEAFAGNHPEQIDPSRQVWRAEFQRSEKWMLIGTAVFLLSLLGVARFLTPSKSGIGTHQGLGLPPCQFRFMFGVDCPSCGMTTSWAYLTRFDLVSSFNANPGGMLLGFFSFTMAVWMLLSVWKGYWWPMWCKAGWVLTAGLGIIAVTLIQWIIKITA